MLFLAAGHPARIHRHLAWEGTLPLAHDRTDVTDGLEMIIILAPLRAK